MIGHWATVWDWATICDWNVERDLGGIYVPRAR